MEKHEPGFQIEIFLIEEHKPKGSSVILPLYSQGDFLEVLAPSLSLFDLSLTEFCRILNLYNFLKLSSESPTSYLTYLPLEA